jgi:hypothetical protein
MIKEAIEYLVSLAENKVYEIEGSTYSDHELVRIPTYIQRPESIRVNGLDSVVKLVRTELITTMTPLFIRVSSPRNVQVFSALDDEMGRDYLYEAICDAPDFRAGWREHESAIIELRSAFVQNEGTEYLLDLLSRICKEDGVTSEDNGVSQTVSARQGITLKNYERLKSRVRLAPYRTFTEIKQPESEFILRLDENTRVGLIEADGGRWKMDAKQSIASYFETALKEEVDSGKVIVMM